MFDISDMVFIAVFRLSQPISITEIERLVDLRGRFGPCLQHQRIWVCCDDECDDDAGDIGDDDE